MIVQRTPSGVSSYDVSAPSGFNQTSISRTVAVGDLDRDGRPDLVTAGFADLDLNPCLQTFLARDGWGSGRTLAHRNNVIIDINTCSANPADTGVKIAYQIATNVTARW